MLHHKIAHRFALPGLVAFEKVSAHETVARGRVGKDAHYPRSTLDFPHEPLQHVGRVDPPAVFLGQVVYGQGLFKLLVDLVCRAGTVLLPSPGHALGFHHAGLYVVELARGFELFGQRALGVPTSRCLAVVATGEQVYRDTTLPGAVVTRIAASHIRVGTFEHFAALRPLPPSFAPASQNIVGKI